MLLALACSRQTLRKTRLGSTPKLPDRSLRVSRIADGRIAPLGRNEAAYGCCFRETSARLVQASGADHDTPGTARDAAATVRSRRVRAVRRCVGARSRSGAVFELQGRGTP